MAEISAVALEKANANRTSPLSRAAALWWATAFVGQWVFLYYITLVYGVSTLTGHFSEWTKNHTLLKGYVAGDTPGNLAFGVHALLAGYVSFGGALQLIPQIRTFAPSFHRWNGRIFLVTALGLSVTGLYMIWVRGATLNMISSVGISGNAALIILFAGLAWRSAIARDFAAHRQWALRTWLVANGQWFFRVGVFGWILLNQGSVGIGENFDGPVIVFWSFGCYLLPLVVFELYERATGASQGTQRGLAGGLAVLSLLAAVGIFGAYLSIWRPVLARF